MDNNPRDPTKNKQRVSEGKERDALAKRVTWPESDWASILLAEDKKSEEKMRQQAGSEGSCRQGLAEHLQGWNPPSADVIANIPHVRLHPNTVFSAL